MPTDRLDDAAEERIRAECPVHGDEYVPDQHRCTCPVQRAAIRADREARPTDHLTINSLWKDEIAHADRLREMIVVLRDVLDSYRSRERECPCCDAPPPANEDAETYHAEDCAWVQSGTALREHEERRR